MRLSRSSRLVSFLAIFTWPFVALAHGPSVDTYTFKTVGTNELKADVHRPAGDAVRPVIVFIHGGALMMGSRTITPRPGSLLEAMLNAGYVVVSIDYRLAPQVKLPAIIEDVADACAWVRKEGPKRFGMKPDELFVMGESAGGYLTLMSGWRVQPPPPRAGIVLGLWGHRGQLVQQAGRVLPAKAVGDKGGDGEICGTALSLLPAAGTPPACRLRFWVTRTTPSESESRFSASTTAARSRCGVNGITRCRS